MGMIPVTVDADTRRALLLLDEVVASVPENEPWDLDAGYLELVRAVEALPENQDGVDKSWLWERYSALRDHFASAVPLGPWIRLRATPRV